MSKLAFARRFIAAYKSGRLKVEPEWNEYANGFCTADVHGKRLWVGNGPFFVDINERNAFGLIGRWLVWWHVVRPALKKAALKHDEVLQPGGRDFWETDE